MIHNHPAFFNGLLCLVLLGSCTSTQVDPTPAAPPPQPVLAPPPPQPQPARNLDEWRDWPVAQGNWIYAPNATGSSAQFISPDGSMRAMLRCDRAAATVSVSLARTLAGTGAASPQMELRTTSGSYNFPTRPAPGGEPFIYANIPARDVMLDNIAYSRGKFLIAAESLQPLTLPAWPETGRVIEDCR
jgi:hypothetical protein